MTPTIREVVNRIRSVLQSVDQTNAAEMAGWATTYAEACRVANSRLGRCGELLSRGLRSEAVALAEAEPKLLETVVVLDFPERGEWDQLALAYGLPGAQALRIDLAEGIQDAYTEEESLDDLLRKHRRLAWARAPLGDRAEVLRTIAQKDQGNPIWNDDLRTFELEILKDFRRQFDRLVAARDLPGMQAALRRVESEGWIAPPPPELVHHVRVSTAVGRLESLGRQLARAFEAGDIATVRACRPRWAEAYAVAGVEPPHAILDRAAPALRWAQEADRREAEDRAYAEALADLDGAMEDGVGYGEFAECEAAVLEFGRGLPPDMHDRWSDYRKRLLRGRRRRRMIGAGLGVAALAVIAGIAIMVAVESGRLGRIRELAAVVEPLIHSDQLEQARALLDAHDAENPGSKLAEGLAEARASLKMKEDKDQLRRAELDSLLKRLGEVPSETKGAMDLLASARKLARRPEEVARIDGAADAIRKASGERRSDLEKRVTVALSDRIEPSLAKLEQAAAADMLAAPVDETLKELEAAYPEGFAEVALWDEALGGRARDVQGRVELLRRRRRERLEREALREGVTKAVAGCTTPEGVGRYGDALAALLASLDPGSAQVRDLKQTLERRIKVWEAVSAWNEAAGAWEVPLTNPPRESLAGRVLQVESLLKVLPEWHGKEGLRDYLALLAAMEVRESESRPRLTRLFRDRLVADVWWLKVDLKKESALRYYLDGPPPEGAASPMSQFSVKYLIDFEGTRSRVPVQISSFNVRAHGRAPQVAMADRAKQLLDGAAEKSVAVDAWERMIVGILGELRDPKHPEIDPILRWALIAATVSRGMEGSALLERSEGMAKLKKALDLNRIDTGVRWMDPEEAKAAPIRTRATNALGLLPDPGDILADVVKKREDIEKALAKQWLRPAGWLTREEDRSKSWRCLSPKPIPKGAELVVLSASGLAIPVGEAKGDEGPPAIDPNAATFEEGTLVYTRGEGRP